MRNKNFFKIFLIASLILSFAAGLPATQKNFLYPFYYRETVEEHSARYKVDKFLAVSVMKVESNFTEGAVSKSGAVGLMQIMPETANWIATQLDEKPPSINELHDCDKNIKYGIWYLSDLEEEFSGNDVLALAAYNAGRGNVNHWIESFGWRENFSDVDEIPFLETRQYVKKVLAYKAKYHELYGSSEDQILFVSK